MHTRRNSLNAIPAQKALNCGGIGGAGWICCGACGRGRAGCLGPMPQCGAELDRAERIAMSGVQSPNASSQYLLMP